MSSSEESTLRLRVAKGELYSVTVSEPLLVGEKQHEGLTSKVRVRSFKVFLVRGAANAATKVVLGKSDLSVAERAGSKKREVSIRNLNVRLDRSKTMNKEDGIFKEKAIEVNERRVFLILGTRESCGLGRWITKTVGKIASLLVELGKGMADGTCKEVLCTGTTNAVATVDGL